MKRLFRILLVTIPLLLAVTTHAQTAPGRQDHAVLRQVAEQFLRAQTAGMPGETEITIGTIDPRLNLAACPIPQAFLSSNNRAWGRTTVGLRCAAPVNWTVYVQAKVSVKSEYVVAAASLAQGQVIKKEDLTKMKGDLSMLPLGTIIDVTQAIGQTVARSLPQGAPLRKDVLRSQRAVQQGQAVRVVTNGPGFSVSTEGKAQTNANEGQPVQVLTNGRQVVTGTARMGGVVEVAF